METQVKNNNFTVAVVAVLVTAAVVVALCALGILGPAGDDDRPPVVVSSGSVEIEGMFDGKDVAKGTFNNVSGNKTWRHHHAGNAPVKFSVVVAGSTSLATVCQSMQIHLNFTKLTFTYRGAGDVQRQFVAEIRKDTANKWGLQFDFQEDVVLTPGATAKLSIPGAIQLLTVDLGGGTICDLGPHGRVEMRQRK